MAIVVFEGSSRAAAEAHAGAEHELVGIDAFEAKPENSVASVVYFGGASLPAIYRVLQAGASVEAYVALDGNDTEAQKNGLLMQLLLQGFVNSNVDVTATGLRLSGTKPGFTEGASAAVLIKPVQKSKWTVVADDDDDMIDEDDLLDDTDEVLKAAKMDCGTGKDGKKRRCKDCTCGMKDENDEPAMSEVDLQLLVSNCGSCYKGDAFRCGSCPFLGQPAFKPGMGKLVLNLDNSDDI
ncbi:hypothetical protein SDRG_01676 [Saprolegnia diclina VS20]|uniref:Anamorsin homolog n=1 Tax=Saprolegnia diclina (strain VS20) TaxID=1156394 RepID=T0R5N3_SAPDV|nr:hypothetical protein SDRG_01676 [Saprolegnia diclina VS20]EQC41720.1 hypothetical protein SDRG_01676 [Saprolegnia diclina VS20]|eukprot:XP_008605434.1 hypothetical protein SDRG_01676 [Saprolegnia diclina VS20]